MNKYSLEEVSQHNTENSLWIVIDDCVYDVTTFYKNHPGGINALLNNGGNNVTEKFNKIKGHTYNKKIVELLIDMLIGKIV